MSSGMRVGVIDLDEEDYDEGTAQHIQVALEDKEEESEEMPDPKRPRGPNPTSKKPRYHSFFFVLKNDIIS